MLPHEKQPQKKVENWLAELKELDFNSIYVKGTENVAADGLSRPLSIPPCRILAALVVSPRVFVPQEGRDYVLKEYHDKHGHQGVNKLLNFLRGHLLTSSASKPMEDITMDLVKMERRQLLVIDDWSALTIRHSSGH